MSNIHNKKSDVVLSYHDCILRQADVNLLTGPFWLNDAIISFYFEYLGQEYKSANSKLLFVSPELTQLLKLLKLQEYDVFLEPLVATEKDFIFFPLNDCDSRNSPGGSHWSLVVFSKSEEICFHLDSSPGMNYSIAMDFSKKVREYLLGKCKGSFIEVECPKQENGHDCGLFVLCYADVISSQVIESSKVKKCNYNIVANLVSEKRESLIALINKLKMKL